MPPPPLLTPEHETSIHMLATIAADPNFRRMPARERLAGKLNPITIAANGNQNVDGGTLPFSAAVSERARLAFVLTFMTTSTGELPGVILVAGLNTH